MTGFVVDHSSTYQVAVGDDRYEIIGWIHDDLAVHPIVVVAGRPVIVHHHRHPWSTYRLVPGNNVTALLGPS